MEYITNNYYAIDIFCGRKRPQIIGDGNCLFIEVFLSSFYNTDVKHLYLRQDIVEAIVLNEECFRPYCLRDTVTEHAGKI